MNAGKLGDWGNWEIRRFGRLGKIITRGKKIRTSWNPGGFGRLGRLRDWEIREIREKTGVSEEWLCVAEVENAVGAEAGEAEELGN